jgi:signal transduction histidine kinase
VTIAAYLLYGALALCSVAHELAPSLPWLSRSRLGIGFVCLWAPTSLLIVALLVRHLTLEPDAEEKARTRLVLAAILVGGALATTDILADMGYGFPHLASMGTLAGNLLFCTAAFRFRLLDRELRRSTALYAASLSAVGLVAYAVLSRVLGGHIAALVAGTVAITLLLSLAIREVATSNAAQKQRIDQLTVMGRFANQMAHDLRNPLATIKGGLQFLQEERTRGRAFEASHDAFLALLLDQVDRLDRVIAEYRRIGRVEPVLRPVDINQLVRDAVALQPLAAPPSVALRLELGPGLPPCELDADLVATALQNVVRNSLEAMSDGGSVTVKTCQTEAGDRTWVAITVEDTGLGIDARHAERAFDDFYTTKAQGSGLGLAFVRRVAQAHRGEASLSSRVGAGTVVSLRFPAGAGSRNEGLR